MPSADENVVISELQIGIAWMDCCISSPFLAFLLLLLYDRGSVYAIEYLFSRPKCITSRGTELLLPHRTLAPETLGCESMHANKDRLELSSAYLNRSCFSWKQLIKVETEISLW